MIYHNPATVLSPRDCIDNVHVLFDGGYTTNPYSIAKITWQGSEEIGIRWNVNQREWDDPDKKSGKVLCIGEPNSRGYPTWFILPKHLLKSLLVGDGQLANTLREVLDTLTFKVSKPPGTDRCE